MVVRIRTTILVKINVCS